MIQFIERHIHERLEDGHDNDFSGFAEKGAKLGFFRGPIWLNSDNDVYLLKVESLFHPTLLPSKRIGLLETGHILHSLRTALFDTWQSKQPTSKQHRNLGQYTSSSAVWGSIIAYAANMQLRWGYSSYVMWDVRSYTIL